jgi:hypothetical protein
MDIRNSKVGWMSTCEEGANVCRYPDCVDGSERHGYGFEFPGSGRMCVRVVSTMFICLIVSNVFRDFINESLQRLGLVAGDDAMSDDLLDPTQAFTLPECELGNLIDVENTMRLANNSAAGRDALTKYIIANDYVAKLVPLVEVAEDFESLTDLHRLCNIVKTIILLNDNAIIEQVVRDDNMMGVLGALECKFGHLYPNLADFDRRP